MLTKVPCVKVGDRDFDEVVGQSVEIGHLHIYAPHIKPVTRRVVEEFKRFCALPIGVKLAYEDKINMHQVGYSPDRTELSLKRAHLGKKNGADRKEHWMVRVKDLPDGHSEKLAWPKLYRDNIWPMKMFGLKAAITEFDNLSLPITLRILEALAVKLGRDRHYFDNIVEGPTITRINHYFPLTPEEIAAGHIWGGEHCDIDFITGPLDSDGPGLWLKRGDGIWIPLARPEGYVTYQYGDMLERESGGVVKSTPHKVVPTEPNVERWSIAPFGHPPCSQEIGLEGASDPALTRRLAGDVLMERLFKTGMGSQ